MTEKTTGRRAAPRVPSLDEVIEARLGRRAALSGVALAGAMAALAGGFVPASALAQQEGRPGPRAARRATRRGFAEIAKGTPPTHQIPPGYRAQVLLRWGDPILKDAPAFDPRNQSAASQRGQFGCGNDYIAFMPLPYGSTRSDRGLLCVNHERISTFMAFPGLPRRGFGERMTRAMAETEMAAVGHSVVEVRRGRGGWEVVRGSRYNRRLNALDTPVRLSGPAAGSPRLRMSMFPDGRRSIGILNNCAGGTTPWGTVLTPAESIQNYFRGNPAGTGTEQRNHRTYGISGRGRYLWARFDDRFNLDKEPNGPNHHGWITEIDPYDPAAEPVKRTALGRGKFECANTTINPDGRVVVYLGDDEAFQFVYRFVTRGRFNPRNRAANRDLLDQGTLSAARFEADGRLVWVPLVFGEGVLTPANGFASQADVLIETRRAAALQGATPCDRPEDVEVNPRTGRVYAVLTKNAARKPDQLNPANDRANNVAGQIIETIAPPGARGPDHAAPEFRWGFFARCGDPAKPEHGARYIGAPSANGWLACPDNLAFDRRGRMWVTTDGQEDVAGVADSLYMIETAGPARGIPRLFLNAPTDAEPTGPCFTPDGRTLFLAIQHPGEGDGSTFDTPSTRWPDFRPDMPARDAVLAITREDGGRIGEER